MLSSVFKKTVYERRWALLWWSLGMFLMTLLIVVLFPTFQEAFGQTLNDVPDSLRQILGNANDYQQIEGFLQLQVFMQMIFLTIIYGVILCTGLIAGEENHGTLQSLLANPISRSRVYFEKCAAAAVILWIVNFAMFIGVALGCILIGESLDWWRLFLATNFQWLVSMVFALFGYMLGAVTGRRGISGALAGVYVFLAYLVSSLTQTVQWMKYPNYLSPLKYFQEPRIMDAGLQLDNTLILVAACAVLILIGWQVFIRRDIFSR